MVVASHGWTSGRARSASGRRGVPRTEGPLTAPRTPFARPRARSRTAAALLSLALLAACSGPVANIRIDLGSGAIVVLRGASVDVDVALTRSGGAADPVALSVTGLPANVTAAFAPPTLDGASVVSVLTLSATAGAVDATTSLTVTATSGALSDDATLQLEVASLAVSGRVEGVYGEALVGVTVASQGTTTSTDGNGDFDLAGLAVPYDLTVIAAVGSGAVHVYEGLTAATPVLVPTFAVGLPVPAPMEALLSGTVLGGAAVAVDHSVIVCVEGLDREVFGCDRANAGDTTYSIATAWFGPAATQARVHALHVAYEADGTPAGFLGYAAVDVALSDGAVLVTDLALEAVADLTFEAAFVPGIGMTVDGAIGFLRFGPYLTMAVFTTSAVGGGLAVPMPALAGTTFDLYAVATDASGTTHAWAVDQGADAGDLALPVPLQATVPANAAVGVDLTTPFGSAGAPGVRTYYFTGTGPQLALTTTRTAVTVPDLVAAGFAFPAGANYQWYVLGHGAADLDAVARGGLADYYRLSLIVNSGGAGWAGDAAFTVPIGARSFTFAP